MVITDRQTQAIASRCIPDITSAATENIEISSEIAVESAPCSGSMTEPYDRPHRRRRQLPGGAGGVDREAGRQPGDEADHGLDDGGAQQRAGRAPPGGAKTGNPAPANAAKASTKAMPMRARRGTVRIPNSGATEQSAVHRNSTSKNPNNVGVRNAASEPTGDQVLR